MGKPSPESVAGLRYCPVEWTFLAGQEYADPFNQVTLDALFTDPAGQVWRVPGFWAGGRAWRVRFAPRDVGRYTYRTVCSAPADAGLHRREGVLQVHAYAGDNLLYHHGPLRVAACGHHLEHLDGQPFLWLADTWWLGLTRRLAWPEGFQALVADRAAKGFSVIQLLAGLYCDMPAFDTRGINEAGHPWEPGYARINPAFFDWADRRIAWLVRSGIVPCILGAWSYHLLWMGVERMQHHWRYLVARYGAYPVAWSLAGGGTMPYYLSEDPAGDQAALQRGWSAVARYLRQLDPYQHPLTIHPYPRQSNRSGLEPDVLLDFAMRHTGRLPLQVALLTREPMAATGDLNLRDVVGEVCYPGMLHVEQEASQRALFWACMLAGASGFSYAVNGMWQFNTPGSPFGPSPHGRTWPNVLWADAFRLPGAHQVGIGKRLLERHPWWQFRLHPEWVTPHADERQPLLAYAGGVPGQVRLIYLPEEAWHSAPQGRIVVRSLAPQQPYRAFFFDPRTGSEHPLGRRQGQTTFVVPSPPHAQDWVLGLECRNDS